jgi:hypothetical protein
LKAAKIKVEDAKLNLETSKLGMVELFGEKTT